MISKIIQSPKAFCKFTGGFLIKLLSLIEQTYLGDRYMGEINQREHLEWCINHLGENKTPQEVETLWVFFKEHYYSKEKTKTTLGELEDFILEG